MTSDAATVVIDNGTHTIKIGFGGDDAPKSVYPSSQQVTGAPTAENGPTLNWDSVEATWRDGITNHLGVDEPSGRNILLSRSLQQPLSELTKTTEILFESFRCAGITLPLQPVLSLYANGGTTGLVVDVGHRRTSVLPVYEGFAVPEGGKVLPYAGEALTNHLMAVLGRTAEEREQQGVVRAFEELKERWCRVSHGAENGANEVPEKYMLPSGEEITLTEKALKVPDALFDPSILGLDDDEHMSLDKACAWSIKQSDVDCRSDLAANVQLCGGTALFPRLADALQMKLPSNRVMKPQVKEPQQGVTDIWIGGSVLVTMNAFERHWMKKETYEDVGAARMVQEFCV